MDSDKPPNENSVLHTGIWEQLSTEQQEYVVRLLSGMAYKMVAAEIERARLSIQEINNSHANDTGTKDHPLGLV